MKDKTNFSSLSPEDTCALFGQVAGIFPGTGGGHTALIYHLIRSFRYTSQVIRVFDLSGIHEGYVEKLEPSIALLRPLEKRRLPTATDQVAIYNVEDKKPSERDFFFSRFSEVLQRSVEELDSVPRKSEVCWIFNDVWKLMGPEPGSYLKALLECFIQAHQKGVRIILTSISVDDLNSAEELLGFLFKESEAWVFSHSDPCFRRDARPGDGALFKRLEFDMNYFDLLRRYYDIGGGPWAKKPPYLILKTSNQTQILNPIDWSIAPLKEAER